MTLLGAEAQRPFRTRAADDESWRLLEAGLRRSATIRHLIVQLEQTDVIVIMEVCHSAPAALGDLGDTRILPSGPAARWVRVRISAAARWTDQLWILGHELQHVVEIALAPWVRDAKDRRRSAGTTAGEHRRGAATRPLPPCKPATRFGPSSGARHGGDDLVPPSGWRRCLRAGRPEGLASQKPTFDGTLTRSGLEADSTRGSATTERFDETDSLAVAHAPGCPARGGWAGLAQPGAVRRRRRASTAIEQTTNASVELVTAHHRPQRDPGARPCDRELQRHFARHRAGPCPRIRSRDETIGTSVPACR